MIGIFRVGEHPTRARQAIDEAREMWVKSAKSKRNLRCGSCHTRHHIPVPRINSVLPHKRTRRKCRTICRTVRRIRRTYEITWVLLPHAVTAAKSLIKVHRLTQAVGWIR